MKVAPQNQAAYAMHRKMMTAAAEDVDLRSYGNNLAMFGNDRLNSVYVGAESLTQLETIQQALFAHPAYAAFSKETADMRESEYDSGLIR